MVPQNIEQRVKHKILDSETPDKIKFWGQKKSKYCENFRQFDGKSAEILDLKNEIPVLKKLEFGCVT